MKKKRKQRVREQLSSQEAYQVQRESRRLEAELQLYTDFHQLAVELMKVTATITSISQQVLEASARYRKTREG